MKYILLNLLFIGSTHAQECNKLGIKLVGDVVFFNKGENNKVVKDIQFNEFPKQWNVNSDRFHHLYLKNNSSNKIINVKIEVQSNKVKNVNFKKIYQIEAKKNKSGIQKIEDVIFHKNILPSYILLPATMKLEVYNKQKLICAETYKFEVVQ